MWQFWELSHVHWHKLCSLVTLSAFLWVPNLLLLSNRIRIKWLPTLCKRMLIMHWCKLLHTLQNILASAHWNALYLPLKLLRWRCKSNLFRYSFYLVLATVLQLKTKFSYTYRLIKSIILDVLVVKNIIFPLNLFIFYFVCNYIICYLLLAFM